MNVSVRPQTRIMAAMLAAGVVAAAPIVTMPVAETLPAMSAAGVVPASFITDALYGFGDLVAAGTSAARLTAELLASLQARAGAKVAS